MKFDRFEEIVVWQKAKELTVSLYSIYRDLKDYSFKDQICRASVSIMNNIAEGFERRSDKEFKQFLYVAEGSSGEIRSMLHLSLDLNYIDKKQYEKLITASNEISKMISGLIKTLS